jgi:hypothetical protein
VRDTARETARDKALVIGRQGRCVIVRWDANSNGTGITAHQKMTAPVFVWSRVRWKPCVVRPRVKEKDGKSSRTRTGFDPAFVVRKLNMPVLRQS